MLLTSVLGVFLLQSHLRSKNMNEAVNRFEWEKAALKAGINGDARDIMWAYATHGSNEAEEVWPGVRTIAEMTTHGQGKVERTRKELIKAGWLTPSGNFTPNGGEKLFFTIGDMEPEGYLAQGIKRVTDKQRANLVPGAKQVSRDSSTTCHETPEDLSRDSRTESLQSRDRTTNNNQEEQLLKNNQGGASVAVAPSLPENHKEEIEDMKIIEETRSQMFKEGTLPLLSNFVGSKVSFTASPLPKKEAGVSVRDNSQKLVQKKLQEARDKQDRAVQHLEHQIAQTRLNDVQAQQARDWFADKDWESHRDPIQKASWAVLKAELLDTSDDILVEW
jgi:hypothetical protein